MSIPGSRREWLEFSQLPRPVVVARVRTHLDRVKRTLDRAGQRESAAVELIRSAGGIAPPTTSDPDPEPTPDHRAAFEAVVNRIEAISGRVENPDGVETMQLRRDALFLEVVGDELEDAA